MVHGKNTDSGVPHTPWVWPCHCLPPTGTSQCFLLGKMRRDKPIWKHGCDYKFRFYLKGLAQGLAHSRHPLNGCLDLGLGSPPTMCRSLDLPLPAPSSPSPTCLSTLHHHLHTGELDTKFFIYFFLPEPLSEAVFSLVLFPNTQGACWETSVTSLPTW